MKTQKIGFSELRRAIAEGGLSEGLRPFVADELVMVRESPFMQQFIHPQTPYIIQDVRVLLITQGQARITVNLIDHELRAGDILVGNYGAVFQPNDVTPDFRAVGIMLSPGLLRTVLADRLPMAILDNAGITRVAHSQAETALARQMMETLWTLLQTYGMHAPVVLPALRQLLEFLELAHARATEQQLAKHQGEGTFQRFIALVNKHCQREHNIAFYASELFLTPHYLSALVKQHSGLTAKDWIDKAIITQAQMLLKSTDLQAAQIAHRLNFPNASFFNKYFKRLTGLTPGEYRGK